MKANITIPQQIKDQEVVSFEFFPKGREVYVRIGEGGNNYRKLPVDISELLKETTAAQKKALKGFFKKIGLQALNKFNQKYGTVLTIDNIEGDVFTEEKV